ncbi:MAG: hypothetical protein LBD30_00750 [Verrucomicrobiales bacterium]|jgi:hypothetical protein|nr:hypothetical protein [Verrucomicrobiales bacterium]
MSQLTADLFAVNLRKVLKTHGHLPAFERSLANPNQDFAVELERPPLHTLNIEVLPPVTNRFRVPAVAVAHTWISHGDLMRDPEIVFAVKPEGWVPYEITQDPVGCYRNAFDADGHFDENISRDLLPLTKAWARNLVVQGWTGESEDHSIKPKLQSL